MPDNVSHVGESGTAYYSSSDGISSLPKHYQDSQHHLICLRVDRNAIMSAGSLRRIEVFIIFSPIDMGVL
jgi:hypothetical protein